MKNSWMKKLTATIGFLAMVFVFTAIPGTKTEAATLKNGAVGPIQATEKGEIHTLKMKKDGYVDFYISSIWTDTWTRSACKVTVYKGSKKISAERTSDIRNSNPLKQGQFFALKKGTYRIKVKMNDLRVSGINGDQMAYDEPNKYVVGTGIKYVSDQGAAKKSKATVIKLKQSKKGIIGLTDAISSKAGSKGEWFKFTLTKKTDVKLYVAAISTNRSAKKSSLEYVLYGPAAKKQLSSLIAGKKVSLSKGTYYVRLYKTGKLDSGYYMIGLNKKVK